VRAVPEMVSVPEAVTMPDMMAGRHMMTMREIRTVRELMAVGMSTTESPARALLTATVPHNTASESSTALMGLIRRLGA
jgi:hypothetical protein